MLILAVFGKLVLIIYLVKLVKISLLPVLIDTDE